MFPFIVGERTPVRRRLESIIPAVWNLCEANSAMFSAIAKFSKDEKLAGFATSPVERLVETENTECLSVPMQSGAW